MSRRSKKALRQDCPGCAGKGTVCCVTWAVVRANAGHDLEYSGVGLPLWPLGSYLEMVRCPFCGKGFIPSGRSS